MVATARRMPRTRPGKKPARMASGGNAEHCLVEEEEEDTEERDVVDVEDGEVDVEAVGVFVLIMVLLEAEEALGMIVGVVVADEVGEVLVPEESVVVVSCTHVSSLLLQV